MNNLPDPTQFKTHSATLTANPRPQPTKPHYDIEAMHKEFIGDMADLSEWFATEIPSAADPEVNPTTLIYELIHKSIITLQGVRAWKPYLGYSKKYQSLTISLLDKDLKVKGIAIRSATDRDGKAVKWKTYGSKRFVPYKIEDDFIFLFSGTAEVLLMDNFGLSYIQLQADGMARQLPEELKSLCSDKVIVVLQDNDDSFKNIVPEIKSFFTRSEVLVIDFEAVLKRPLNKGYDFRDLCNEVKDPKELMQLIENEIITLEDRDNVK